MNFLLTMVSVLPLTAFANKFPLFQEMLNTVTELNTYYNCKDDHLNNIYVKEAVQFLSWWIFGTTTAGGTMEGHHYSDDLRLATFF